MKQYDPQKAAQVWQRVQNQPSTPSGPENLAVLIMTQWETARRQCEYIRKSILNKTTDNKEQQNAAPFICPPLHNSLSPHLSTNNKQRRCATRGTPSTELSKNYGSFSIAGGLRFGSKSAVLTDTTSGAATHLSLMNTIARM